MESWLVDGVVPAVEVDRPRPASRRTLAGFSMGGCGALNLGLRHPEVFGSLVCFSGYSRADDPEGVFGGDQGLLAANSPVLRAADPTLRPAAGLRVAIAETAHEPSPIPGQAAGTAAALREGGADVMERHARGHHSWRSVAALWPSVLTSVLT